MNKPQTHTASNSSAQGHPTAMTSMRELTAKEQLAVSGGSPALILLGVAAAGFGIGVIADNYYNGPMADWWYKTTH